MEYWCDKMKQSEIIVWHCYLRCFNIPYSRGLACDRQIKICQYFLLAYIHMMTPYRTAKFKSADIFTIVIQGPTAKFNSRQYSGYMVAWKCWVLFLWTSGPFLSIHRIAIRFHRGCWHEVWQGLPLCLLQCSPETSAQDGICTLGVSYVL